MEQAVENLPQQGQDNTLVIERVFNASVEHVFRAWTEPEQLVRWWGPKGFSIPESSLDIRPGGKWRTTMRSPDGQSHIVSGVFKEVTQPSRLVFTWAWEEAGQRGHETEVTISLSPQGEKTLLRLEQTTFESNAARDRHNEGWSSSLDCLDDALS